MTCEPRSCRRQHPQAGKRKEELKVWLEHQRGASRSCRLGSSSWTLFKQNDYWTGIDGDVNLQRGEEGFTRGSAAKEDKRRRTPGEADASGRDDALGLESQVTAGRRLERLKGRTCSCCGSFAAPASRLRQHHQQGNISGSSTQTCSSRSAGTLRVFL